jgi:hypothetical protein
MGPNELNFILICQYLTRERREQEGKEKIPSNSQARAQGETCP